MNKKILRFKIGKKDIDKILRNSPFDRVVKEQIENLTHSPCYLCILLKRKNFPLCNSCEYDKEVLK